MLKQYTFTLFFLITFSIVNYLAAEPFVVLQYNSASELSDRSNEFAQNPDHSEKHTIMPGESLMFSWQRKWSQIMQRLR